ncbi:hypothetical protein VYU27_007119 [Nannochloropsis oceanica]
MPRRSTSCPCWQSICLFFFLFCRNVIAAFVLPFSSSSSSSAINTCGRQAKSYRASQPPAVLVKCNVQSTAAVGIDRGAWLRRPRCLAPLSAVSDPVEQQQLKEIPHGIARKQNTVPSSSPPFDCSPRLLLASGGFRDEARIQFLSDEIRNFFGEGVSELLFIPFGAKDHVACMNTHETSGMAGGYKLRSIDNEKDPSAAIKRSQGIYVCGGNVFRLLRELRRRGLLEDVREAVMEGGIPYLGISAGTVLACPTICTSNDMPIVDPGVAAGESLAAAASDIFSTTVASSPFSNPRPSSPSSLPLPPSSFSALSALGLIDFQINAHFFGGDFYSQDPATGKFQVHFGMNRVERIREFLEDVSDDAPVPVVGLAEGCMLKCEGGKIELLGESFSPPGSPMTIFRKHFTPLEVKDVKGKDLAPLIRG